MESSKDLPTKPIEGTQEPMPAEEPSANESQPTAEGESVEQQIEIRVTISPDGRQAFLGLSANPPEPYPFTLEAITHALEERGVVWGVLTQEIVEIVNRREYVSDFLVAFGQDPEDGENARIEFLFNPSPKPYSIETEDRIDWHDVGLIQTVAEGAPVARKIPARSGQSGMTVKGKSIEPRKIVDVRLPVGRGTKIDEANPNQLLAAVAGCVALAGNHVVVNKALSVPRDVDFSIGNIQLDGSVQIGGNVLTGFRVRATGDIHIAGFVEAATVESGGSVWISKGVLGHNKTIIRAGNHIHLRFASNASITASGDITVQGEVVNCQMESGGTITVGNREGTRSRIVGGKLTAAKAIFTGDLGSEGSAATILTVTQEAISTFHRRERETAERIARLRDDQSTINTQLAKILNQRLAGESRLDQAGAQLLERLTTATRQIEDEILSLENQMAENKAELARVGNPKVVVYGTLFPGVQIAIGRMTRSFRDRLTRVQVVVDRDAQAIAVVAV